MAAGEKTFYCEKCGRTKGESLFYLSQNLEKYPEKHLKMCKECVALHVDNFDPSTYTWILQECDVPYIPDEWNKLLANYGRDRSKLTGSTILGRYLAKMRLKKFKDFRWKDNEILQEIKNTEIKEAMERSGYSPAEIAQAIAKGAAIVPTEEVEVPEYSDKEEPVKKQSTFAPDPSSEDYFARFDTEEDDLGKDLTEDDKKYLRLKWGKTYRPEEWVRLEQLYREMTESYEIVTAGHIDTLKLVCKASLKTNQLMDIGDIEGAQKMSKMYDQLMRSGKFTAAQNKGQSQDEINSFSELILMCEKDGFIPRYYTEGPQDKVDYVIQDMQDYTRSLIIEEMHLGPLIERAVAVIEEEARKDRENENDSFETIDEEKAFEEELFAEKEIDELDDDDYEAFNKFLDSLENEDEVSSRRAGDW